MAYSIYAGVLAISSESELRQLTDDAKSGQVDQAKVSAAIVSADAEIDSYAAARYLVPLNPAPPRVSELSALLALANLHHRVNVNLREGRQKELDAARAWLKQLAAGTVVIGAASAQQPPQTSGGPRVSVPTARKFDDKGLGNF